MLWIKLQFLFKYISITLLNIYCFQFTRALLLMTNPPKKNYNMKKIYYEPAINGSFVRCIVSPIRFNWYSVKIYGKLYRKKRPATNLMWFITWTIQLIFRVVAWPVNLITLRYFTIKHKIVQSRDSDLIRVYETATFISYRNTIYRHVERYEIY